MKTNKLIKLYFREKVLIARNINIKEIEIIFKKIVNTYEKNGSLFLMANGGPAGLVDNAATDLRFHPFVQDDKSRLQWINNCNHYQV